MMGGRAAIRWQARIRFFINPATKLVIPAAAEWRAGIRKRLGITGFLPSQE